jgi:hypothetical protein
VSLSLILVAAFAVKIFSFKDIKSLIS